MARQSLGLGEWGDITISRHSGRASPYRARARYRGYDGRGRVIERWGSSQRNARRSVEQALAELIRGRQLAGTLSSSDTFSEAATIWLQRIERLARMGQRSPGTVETYQRQLRGHVLPVLGALRLAEITTPLVDRFVSDLHEHVGAATARTCRSIVSGVMGLAVRQGAVVANPTRDLERLHSGPAREPRALSEEERTAWFVGLAQDKRAIRQDLVDLSAFLLATGLRIGEALAVLWGNIDLESGMLTVEATLIRVTGQGLLRKGTKSRAGQRSLLLPSWAVAMLRSRAQIGVGPSEPIFATTDGGFRDPRNVSRALASARDRLGLEWVTAHSWRKTTATILDSSGATARMIADQLGHSRVSMTQDVYLGRRVGDVMVLKALEGADPRRAGDEKGGEKSG